MAQTPKLLILPNVLDESLDHRKFFPSTVDDAVRTLDGLFAESYAGGRHFLRRFSFLDGKKFSEIPLVLLNEHTQEKELLALLQPVLLGQIWGIVSDAGLPCLADPGAHLIALARKKNIEIEAFVGPSSIVLALQLSGLFAQRFSFHGYLPHKPEELQKKLQHLQMVSSKENMVQVFIETPYRTKKMLQQLLTMLSDRTVLCVAWDLTLPSQRVCTQTVKEWKQKPLPEMEKNPAVFLFQVS